MTRRCHRRPFPFVEQLERRELLSANSLTPFGTLASWVQDDVGNTFETAAEVALTDTGSGSQAGTIERAFDRDLYRFTATASGEMMIREIARWGSRLDPLLRVYDENGQLIAHNDDDGLSLNSRVMISVTAGLTYYVQAGGYGWSRDSYQLQLATVAPITDDFPNSLAEAATWQLAPDGSGTQTGVIERAGDVDILRVEATVSGQMTITQSAAAQGRLDSYLAVYDAGGQLIARNDDHDRSLNSRIDITVEAGSVYYIKAAAFGRSTGAYNIELTTITQDDDPEPVDPSADTPADPDGGSGTDPDSGTSAEPDTGTSTGPDSDTPSQPDTETAPDSSEGTTDTTTADEPWAFQIDVTVSGFTTAQLAIVQQAVDFWEQVIVGDLPDVVYRGVVIDDVTITITSLAIDGAGGVLGQAAATALRSGSSLPYAGFIQLDTSDVATMENSGSLLGVLTHEIAHVLGFGVLWSRLGLLSGTGTSSPGFTGANAVAEYNALFGTNVTAVPVEADGGSGTALAHWDESILGSELMTGWFNAGQTNALSRLTVASLADMGYEVDLDAAQTYVVSTTSIAAASAANRSNVYRPGY